MATMVTAAGRGGAAPERLNYDDPATPHVLLKQSPDKEDSVQDGRPQYSHPYINIRNGIVSE